MNEHPPSNPDIERSILSAILFEQESMAIALNAGVTETTFSRPANGIIFTALYELYEEGNPLDQLTLANFLQCSGKLEQVGGEAAIASLAGEITGAANVAYHCKVIRKLEANRKLYSILRSGVGMALEDRAEPEEISALMQEDLARLQDEFQAKPKGVTELIREFVESTTGIFQSTEVTKFIENVNKGQQKTNSRTISTILGRLAKDGIIVKDGTRNGVWRKVDDECKEMNWLNADTTTLPVRWPFKIEKYAAIMPKSIVIVSGESNAGKTAFLMNTALMNMNDFDIHYFNSEMCEQELLLRAQKFDTLRPKDWNVHFYERSSSFADVIRPDGFNIIDYLEVFDDFWRVGGMIKDIFNRLNKGVAVIALQKDPNKEFGRGGAITKDLSRLYINLKYDKERQGGICEIVKGKLRVTDLNPDGMKMHYKLHNGAKIFETEWEIP